jgi:hypothetical protein
MSEYRNKIYIKLNKRPEKQDVNGEWGNIKDAIIQSASEVLKQNSSLKRNEWWDENCKKAVNKKNETKTLQKRTRNSQEMYRIQRLLPNKLCKQKMKKWINNKLLEAEKAYRRNDARKFYKDITQFSGDYTQHM